MERYSSVIEICATCQHWLGPRNLRSNRAEIEITAMTVRGRCSIAKVLSTQGESATNRCFNWQKWNGFDY